jgi:hypothetical protein
VGAGTLVGVAVGIGVVVAPVVPPHPETITAMKMMMATGTWYIRNLICLFLLYQVVVTYDDIESGRARPGSPNEW